MQEANPEIYFLCPPLKKFEGGKIPVKTALDPKSKWSTKGNISDEIMNVVVAEEKIFMYADRENALLQFDPIISSLDEGTLSGNCWNHIVIGPKSIGKTTFLQALVIATQKIGKRTLAAYVNVSMHLHKNGPFELICDILEEMITGCSKDEWASFKSQMNGDIGALLELLRQKRWRIFLVLDEYSIIYTLPVKKGYLWKSQMYTIGNWSSEDNPINVILSDSAPYFSSLCFGKHDLTSEFPSYSKRVLNLDSDRFHVIEFKTTNNVPSHLRPIEECKQRYVEIEAKGNNHEEEKEESVASDDGKIG